MLQKKRRPQFLRAPLFCNNKTPDKRGFFGVMIFDLISVQKR